MSNASEKGERAPRPVTFCRRSFSRHKLAFSYAVSTTRKETHTHQVTRNMEKRYHTHRLSDKDRIALWCCTVPPMFA